MSISSENKENPVDFQVATVVSNFDPHKEGTIFCTWGTIIEPQPVMYTSPYINKNKEGFVAIPSKGAIVLICKPNMGETRNQWFYISTIYGTLINESTKNSTGVETDPYLDPNRARGIPQKMSFSSAKGNKVSLSDEYSPVMSNIGVILESSEGKILHLDDSTDSVMIRSSTGQAKISLAGPKCENLAGQNGIEIDCVGNVFVTSQNGTMNMILKNGKTINIFNDSDGSNAASGDSTAGNINIKSKYGDVDISADYTGQQINISTAGENGNISLFAGGVVNIEGTKGVYITSTEGDVVVTGGPNIRLN